MSKQVKGARDGGGRAEQDDPWAALSETAGALERELRRFEQMAAAARRMPIDTRKGLERAARATSEAAHGQEQVNGALSALVQAIQAAQRRHEANAQALTVRGEEIRARADELAPLHERYAALGDESRAINELVQQAAVAQRDATTPQRVSVLVAFIGRIEERMGKLVDDARDLGRQATEASAADVAEQADSLRQQVAAARNKLGLLRKSFQEVLAAQKPN